MKTLHSYFHLLKYVYHIKNNKNSTSRVVEKVKTFHISDIGWMLIKEFIFMFTSTDAYDVQFLRGCRSFFTSVFDTWCFRLVPFSILCCCFYWLTDFPYILKISAASL